MSTPRINHNTQTHIKESAIKHRKPLLHQSIFFSQSDRSHPPVTIQFHVVSFLLHTMSPTENT